MTVKKISQIVDSRCPDCNKLLAKSIIVITLENLDILKELGISFGSQTVCKRCKKVKQTMNIFKLENTIKV